MNGICLPCREWSVIERRGRDHEGGGKRDDDDEGMSAVVLLVGSWTSG